MAGKSEVLIVGAGPVGLLMALECARHGVAFRIVDMASGPSDKSKALVIWSAVQEVFAAAGVLEGIQAGALKPGGIRVCSRSRVLAEVPFAGAVDSPYPDPLILPQSMTEAAMLAKLASLGHAVERQVEFVSVGQDAEGVDVVLRAADGSESTVRADFLVGCDGAHSAVRHAVGASFAGQAMPECFILCDVEVASPRAMPQDVHLFISREGPMPMFPIRDHVWRIVSSRGSGDGTAPPTLEEMQEHVNARGPRGLVLSNPEWLACFKISERKVDRFRHGRVLLAGDAAHIHSPAGGQGMNTGLQDAFNLAWKLGAILRQQASTENLLESYEAERSPVAAMVIAQAGFRMRAAMVTRGPLAFLRDAAAGLLGQSRHAKSRLTVAFSGTAIRYKDGPLVMSDRDWHEDWQHHGFAPGLRIRDAMVESDGAHVSLFQEVMGTGRHTLLLFSGRRPNYRAADLINNLRTEAANASTLITSLAVWSGGHAPDDSWLTDPEGSAHLRFGSDLPSAYLIRPDGVVMTRSQPALAGMLASALDRLRPA